MNETPNQQLQRLLNEKTASRKGKSKYGNKPIVRDGVRYDSGAEYAYKGVLDLQVKAGQITGYDYHVKLPLIAQGGKLVGYYEVDYLVYCPDGSQQYHDVKSSGTDTYIFNWKARHVAAQYGVEVVFIDSKTLRPKDRSTRIKPVEVDADQILP